MKAPQRGPSFLYYIIPSTGQLLSHHCYWFKLIFKIYISKSYKLLVSLLRLAVVNRFTPPLNISENYPQ